MSGKMRLCVLPMGLAIGVTWAIGFLLLGLMAWTSHWGEPVVKLFSTVYVGYAPTLVGSLWGTLWAFADGFIGGVLIAVIYNLFLGKSD